MIVQRDENDVVAAHRGDAELDPVAVAICTAASVSPESFQVTSTRTGVELAACSREPSHQPGRARMKVFSPKPGHTFVFFYKKSLVPYSRDRYSYGGVDLRSSQPTHAEIEAWLEFLSSGFHPERRPPGLRRAFPYEVPE